MNSIESEKLQIGDWQIDFASGLAVPFSTTSAVPDPSAIRLEPKSCQVLTVLATHAGQVVSKQMLIDAVWPDSYASDDTIARTVSRLRTSLGDDPKQPRYIETLPKRGYRLCATVQPVTALARSAPRQDKRQPLIWLAGLFLAVVALIYLFPAEPPSVAANDDLLQRANDYYHQMRLADNEMAIALYEQKLELDPVAAEAYAGLANALVQKAFRWSEPRVGGEPVSITDQYQNGALSTPAAQANVRRAAVLAERAVALQPNSAIALKALGFVRSAQGEWQAAIELYERAIAHDPNAWPVWINLADLYTAQQQDAAALAALEQAFAAMTLSYNEDPVQIRPWYAQLGVLIADRYWLRHDDANAETWYRTVLSFAPLDPAATIGLAAVLQTTGDKAGGLRLCSDLQRRLKQSDDCATVLKRRLQSRAETRRDN
ncbi:winged helix-turn-helix domain-containing protein [Pseudidiomarina salilacus]|uniref:winged helix-turn-helix domain-containing protein n=1 Tax=Pseudidiomarina salilacus TaxID=3384452 RepID=UPI0039852914